VKLKNDFQGNVGMVLRQRYFGAFFGTRRVGWGEQDMIDSLMIYPSIDKIDA
jgi:hypothetical protein